MLGGEEAGGRTVASSFSVRRAVHGRYPPAPMAKSKPKKPRRLLRKLCITVGALELILLLFVAA